MALLTKMKKRNTVTHNAASSCRLEIVSQLITLVVIHQSAAFSGKTTLEVQLSPLHLPEGEGRGHIVLFYMTAFSQTLPTHRWRGGGGYAKTSKAFLLFSSGRKLHTRHEAFSYSVTSLFCCCWFSLFLTFL